MRSYGCFQYLEFHDSGSPRPDKQSSRGSVGEHRRGTVVGHVDLRRQDFRGNQQHPILLPEFQVIGRLLQSKNIPGASRREVIGRNQDGIGLIEVQIHLDHGSQGRGVGWRRTRRHQNQIDVRQCQTRLFEQLSRCRRGQEQYRFSVGNPGSGFNTNALENIIGLPFRTHPGNLQVGDNPTSLDTRYGLNAHQSLGIPVRNQRCDRRGGRQPQVGYPRLSRILFRQRLEAFLALADLDL